MLPSEDGRNTLPLADWVLLPGVASDLAGRRLHIFSLASHARGSSWVLGAREPAARLLLPHTVTVQRVSPVGEVPPTRRAVDAPALDDLVLDAVAREVPRALDALVHDLPAFRGIELGGDQVDVDALPVVDFDCLLVTGDRGAAEADDRVDAEFAGGRDKGAGELELVEKSMSSFGDEKGARENSYGERVLRPGEICQPSGWMLPEVRRANSSAKSGSAGLETLLISSMTWSFSSLLWRCRSPIPSLSSRPCLMRRRAKAA